MTVQLWRHNGTTGERSVYGVGMCIMCVCIIIWMPIVADILKSPSGAIHFRLLIKSCDRNITASEVY